MILSDRHMSIERHISIKSSSIANSIYDWSMVEFLNDTVDISNFYLQFTVQFVHTGGW